MPTRHDRLHPRRHHDAESAAAAADGQAGEVDQGGGSVSGELAQGDFEIVFEHGETNLHGKLLSIRMPRLQHIDNH